MNGTDVFKGKPREHVSHCWKRLRGRLQLNSREDPHGPQSAGTGPGGHRGQSFRTSTPASSSDPIHKAAAGVNEGDL